MTFLMVTCGSIIYINAYIMHHVSTYAGGERKVLNTRTHSGGDNETIFIAMKIFVRPIIKKFQVLFALYKISYCILYPNAWDCNLPVPLYKKIYLKHSVKQFYANHVQTSNICELLVLVRSFFLLCFKISAIQCFLIHVKVTLITTFDVFIKRTSLRLVF